MLFFYIALGLSFFGGVYGIGLAFVVLFLPQLSLQVRRLHDTDHSGWWVFSQILPICAIFPLLIWYLRKGTEGDNRFGADPLLSPSTPSYVMVPATTMTEKAEQLAKIKGLLESGTITQEEFDRMKADVLAS